MINIADMWEEERDEAWIRRACQGYFIVGMTWEETVIAELKNYCIWL